MKISSALRILLYLTLSILFCYLLYKTWDIFGFWTLVWTGILSILSTLFSQLIGSKVEKEGVIIFNPKEWPKLINILISAIIGYYLYTIIKNPEISQYDYVFGLSYLILLTAVPILIALYKIVRDRNDYISIDNTSITYRDNQENATIEINDISKVELTKKAICISLKNSNVVMIKTSQMNFNTKDLIAVLAEIKSRLPQETSPEVEQLPTDQNNI